MTFQTTSPNCIIVGNKSDNNRQKIGRPFIRLMSDNIWKFKDYLNYVDWESILMREDCDKDYSSFIEILTLGYEKCFLLVHLFCKWFKDKKKNGPLNVYKLTATQKIRLYRIVKNKYSTSKEAKYLKYKNR